MTIQRSGTLASPWRLGRWAFFAASFVALVAPSSALAHGPIFSPSPHTPFKGAFAVGVEYARERESATGEDTTVQELALELEYGVTADWELIVEVPTTRKEQGAASSDGLGDMVLATKYRFLRIDTPGLQRSVAALFQVKLPTGDDEATPRLGSGSTDFLGGITAGYEGRRWYGFTSVRYRRNTEGGGGLKKGDKQLFDVSGGVRPWLTGYREPDWVFLLELNWENAKRDEIDGTQVPGTGGQELFLSPGIFWTLRNHAIKGGLQLPVAQNRRRNEADTDYRFKIEWEVHF